jgi:hypothetical protein
VSYELVLRTVRKMAFWFSTEPTIMSADGTTPMTWQQVEDILAIPAPNSTGYFISQDVNIPLTLKFSLALLGRILVDRGAVFKSMYRTEHRATFRSPIRVSSREVARLVK